MNSPLDVLCQCARELSALRPLTRGESAVRRRLEGLLGRYLAHPVKARHRIREAIAQGAEGCAAALSLLDAGVKSHGTRFVADLLLTEGYLADFVCDPDSSTPEMALRTARRIGPADPYFVPRVSAHLTASAPDEVATRALTLLEAVAPAAEVRERILPLLDHPSARIRSKAVRIISKAESHGDWWQRAFEDPDPRVRANVIESLWEARTRAARAHFTKASEDPHHRVRTAAFVGLYLCGDTEAAGNLERLAAHESADFRAAAAWAMGATADPCFEPSLRGLRKDPSVLVRRSALQALVRIHRSTTGNSALHSAQSSTGLTDKTIGNRLTPG